MDWRWWVDLAIVFLAAPLLLWWPSRWWPEANLVVHFLLHTTVLLTLFAAVLIALNEHRRALGATACAMIAWLVLAPEFRFAAWAQSDHGSLRVMAANIKHDAIREPGELSGWLNGLDTDLVFLTELAPEQAKSLTRSGLLWPYLAGCGEAFLCETMILSRHRLIDVDYAVDRASGGKVLLATAETPTGVLRVGVTHLIKPVRDRGTRLHRDQARFVADIVREEEGAFLLAGDFNATAWSGALHPLKEVGLRFPTFFEGTWPTRLPRFLRLGIDHVAVSCGMTLGHWHTVEIPASDHVAVDVSLKKSPDRC